MLSFHTLIHVVDEFGYAVFHLADFDLDAMEVTLVKVPAMVRLRTTTAPELIIVGLISEQSVREKTMYGSWSVNLFILTVTMIVNCFFQALVEKSRGGLTPIDSNISAGRKSRRKTIRQKPNTSLSLWSIMKNCIGKELSRIPVPVGDRF